MDNFYFLLLFDSSMIRILNLCPGYRLKIIKTDKANINISFSLFLPVLLSDNRNLDQYKHHTMIRNIQMCSSINNQISLITARRKAIFMSSSRDLCTCRCSFSKHLQRFLSQRDPVSGQNDIKMIILCVIEVKNNPYFCL